MRKRPHGNKSGDSASDPLKPIAIEDIPPHDLTEYLDLFKTIDRDSSGGIETVELVYAFNSMGVDASPGDMHRLIQGMDESGDGNVDFREFAGCLHAVTIER